MCGIAGFVDFNKKSDLNILKNMTDVLYHRGPDDSGYSFYSSHRYNIGLGHRRLSILDLSKHGHQPMKFNNLEIIYNGEVYNFKEIRQELENYGYKFNSNSDTEVILKSFHKWGFEAIHKFNGMFTIVLYDKENERIIFVRDRTGVKPLYYFFKNGLFLFSSELKSFHKHPLFRRDINEEALAQFLILGYIPKNFSIFKNTWKLKPGHYGILDLKTASYEEYKYWNIVDFYNKPKLNISLEDAIAETENLMKSSFKYRMVSDVPVGVFLSGGYDSSTVTAILQKSISEKLKTFTIGFYEEEFNEAPYAKKIAEYLGTDHTEYYCTQEEALEIIPELSNIYDEPFGDPSAIPTILVSRITRKKVKVSLSADGGDELFGGYDKYLRGMKFYSLMKKVPLKKLISNALLILNPEILYFIKKKKNLHFKYEKLRDMFLSKSLLDFVNNFAFYFSPWEINKLLNIDLPSIEDKVFYDYSRLKNDSEIEKAMAVDYKTYLPDDILVKVDRATMGVSLEGREPLLDHRLVEFVAQLPIEYKIGKGKTKVLLKEIAHKYIPRELLERPKKGFSVPIHKWLKDDLRDVLYQSISNLEKFDLLNNNYIYNTLKKWEAGNSGYSRKLWLLIILSQWGEKWL